MQKRNFVSILTAAVCFISCFSFAACGKSPAPEEPAKEEEKKELSVGYEGTVGGLTFSLPKFTEKKGVKVHTELQSAYLKDGYHTILEYADGINMSDDGPQDLSHPEPVKLSFTVDGAAEGAKYTLSLSEAEDMSGAVQYVTSEPFVSVYNLKIATTYYWTVGVDDVTSGVAYFTTEDKGPRNVYVDGVANVRDLGGWVTESGKRVKQGLIYRSGRFNANYTGERTITDQGIKTLLEEFKIKSEIDLRGGKNDPSESAGGTKSAISDTVAYHHIGMVWSGDPFSLNKKEIKAVFELLAREDSYPLIFHCSIGTDRTGMVALLLNGLLGVAEKNLYVDYLFSNFGYIETTRDISYILGGKNAYVPELKLFEGATFSEKIRNALLSIGLSNETLDSVCRIFLEN